MAVRSGMSNLIQRLRGMTVAGTAEYSIGTVSYFSDQQMQDALDAHASLLEAFPIRWLPDTVSGGAIEYHRAAIGWRDLEEAESGTTNWVLRDSLGTVVGTADYTKDYIGGYLAFTADQGGTAYYLTARSYDLNSAAADVWQQRAAYYAPRFDVESDSQSFKRSQAHANALKMVAELRSRANQNKQRGNLQTSAFRRTDIAPRWD